LPVLADIHFELFCSSLADIGPVFCAQACGGDVRSAILSEVYPFCIDVLMGYVEREKNQCLLNF
jgi:hypothetical protein